MGREDYATTGGTLKLKGVSSGAITKKKKRKTKKVDDDTPTETAADSTALSKPADRSTPTDTNTSGPEREGSAKESDAMESDASLPSVDSMEGKTESERKFEEMRRKRLDQRLIKEGAKTHKERVDEFNKYLSNLSEHHDMPRIGPG